jgi:hypothetical protein
MLKCFESLSFAQVPRKKRTLETSGKSMSDLLAKQQALFEKSKQRMQQHMAAAMAAGGARTADSSTV